MQRRKKLWINLNTGCPYTEEQAQQYNALVGRQLMVPIDDPRAVELLDRQSDRAARIRERWKGLFGEMLGDA